MTAAVALPQPPVLVAPASRPSATVRPPDLMLVAACQAGDLDQYRPLVERYQRIAFSIAVRLVGSRAEAEDVVQHAFVEAFRALSRFDGGGNPDAFRIWLLRIVVNRAKDVLKSKRRTESSLDGEVEAGDAAFAQAIADPEVLTERSELRRHLEIALATLGPKYRESIVLKDIEELSYEEMREILRLPITTLKIRVVRARIFLREALQRAGKRRQP